MNIARARIHGFEPQGGYDWGSVGPRATAQHLRLWPGTGTDKHQRPAAELHHPDADALGLQYDTAPWSLYCRPAHHYAAAKDKDIDLVSIGNNKAGTTQFARHLPPRSTWVRNGASPGRASTWH